MKICFLQVFDDLSKARDALGYVKTAMPNHSNKLHEQHNQVQIFTDFKNVEELKAYGELDGNAVYVVTSIAP